MKRVRMVLCVLLFSAILSFAPSPSTVKAASDLDLAYRWAPVHFQDTDDSDADADYLTAVDYDGDWNTQNNWENQDDDSTRLTGTVYYSVTETVTHWYLVYSFYHPRDWVDYPDLGLDSHENDMEGVLVIVRKDGSTYGKLEGMVTVAHLDFYSYIPAGSPLTNGQENIDGTVRMITTDYPRPATFQEAKGHGVKAWDGSEFPGGDGVVYYPDRFTGEVPSSGNDRSVKYRLVDTFEANGLWSHRYDPQTFASWGTFLGDNGKDNAANTAWAWDDHDDGPVYAGEMATDPAHLTDVYFDGLGNFSTTYLRNGYVQ
ncbi:NPP1 family protein [Polycladomyces zharkentensis]